MKTTILFIAAAGAAVLATYALPAKAQNRSPEQAAEWRMSRMDSDGNGSVSKEEFTVYRTAWVRDGNRDEKMLRPKAIDRAFGRMDTNGDGVITLEEITETVRAQQANNPG